MQRRKFLRNIVPLGVGVWAAPHLIGWTEPASRTGLNPAYLKSGDLIAITCPASPVGFKEVMPGVDALEHWGFRVKLGETIGRRWQRFGGTDDERAADFQQLLDDPEVKAIIFARGGYGTMRMMDKLNWEAFSKKPKWLVGYSDITALHCHINSQFAIPTLHARMASSLSEFEDDANNTLHEALTGKRTNYRFGSHPLNREGMASGMLVGGNLSMIYAMQASASELKTDGKILFLEDVSEYKYTVDRMMMNLKRSGKLSKLAGLIVGGFTATKTDSEEPFTMSMDELIFEKVKEYGYPVCFDFPAGHVRRNLALKLGMHYNLYVTDFSGSLSEIEDPHPVLPPIINLDTIPQQDSLSQLSGK